MCLHGINYGAVYLVKMDLSMIIYSLKYRPDATLAFDFVILQQLFSPENYHGKCETVIKLSMLKRSFDVQ